MIPGMWKAEEENGGNYWIISLYWSLKYTFWFPNPLKFTDPLKSHIPVIPLLSIMYFIWERFTFIVKYTVANKGYQRTTTDWCFLYNQILHLALTGCQTISAPSSKVETRGQVEVTPSSPNIPHHFVNVNTSNDHVYIHACTGSYPFFQCLCLW